MEVFTVEMPKNQNLRIERFDYRLTFAKKGRARYISHLDLMRTMQRAIKRAGVPIWYTQGFNPHAYLMFPLALPLGTDSEVELLDIALIENWDYEKLVQQLNKSMPEGLYFVKAAEPKMKHTEIAYAEYEIKASFDKPSEQAFELFKSFINSETIEIEKRVKPKKGKKATFKTIDIKPYLTILGLEIRDDKVWVNLRLPAGTEMNLNTGSLIDAFCMQNNVQLQDIYTKRTKILCKNGEKFT